jgi:hypothetical protein
MPQGPAHSCPRKDTVSLSTLLTTWGGCLLVSSLQLLLPSDALLFLWTDTWGRSPEHQLSSVPRPRLP